jgi:phytoene desaturase
MLFSFQTLYLGLSPYEAPWVYSTLVHMELAEGVWYPMGGVAKISEEIAGLAMKKGVQIHLNQPAKAIEGKSLILESGGSREFDAIICNADLPYAERELLGQAEKVRQESCSALMIYAEYEGELPDLLHHNVFFSSDFRGNLDQIFNLAKIPEDPSFYACISAKTDPNRAKPGTDNLYILIPCPNLERRWSDKDEELLIERAFARLESEIGFCPSNIRHMARFGPRDWRDRFNLDKGAAFGLSHHFSQSAYFRPSNHSRVNPNVYFVGASTIPGNGMPMVVISAELVAQRILQEIHES